MAQYNQVINLIASMKADKKSKDALKKEMIAMFKDIPTTIAFESDEFKNTIKDIAKAMNTMLVGIGKGIDIEEMLNMPGEEAWKKLGTIAGNDFVNAFDVALKGIDSQQFQEIVEHLKDISTTVTKISQKSSNIELFNEDQLQRVISALSKIGTSAGAVTKKNIRRY